jgi:hypothetical protein
MMRSTGLLFVSLFLIGHVTGTGTGTRGVTVEGEASNTVFIDIQ